MNSYQLQKGKELEVQINKLQSAKEFWEQADMIKGDSAGLFKNNSWLRIRDQVLHVEIDGEEFKLLQYMRLSKINQELKQLETEFQNL